MPGTPAGLRRSRIEFRRPAASRDALGVKAETATSSLGFERARIFWGAGSERREAGVEHASQAATFNVLANSKTRGVLPTDRILYGGLTWDITGIARPDRNPAEIEFTAVASRG